MSWLAKYASQRSIFVMTTNYKLNQFILLGNIGNDLQG